MIIMPIGYIACCLLFWHLSVNKLREDPENNGFLLIALFVWVYLTFFGSIIIWWA